MEDIVTTGGLRTGRRKQVTRPVTTTIRTESAQAVYKNRLDLIHKIHLAERDFMLHPTHLNAALLAALRTAVSELELQIVDLNLNDTDAS